MLPLTIEDEMDVELVAVDSGEVVAPNPVVDELRRFTLLVPPDSKMLVASEEDEASATEDDVTVVDDIANGASVTDG